MKVSIFSLLEHVAALLCVAAQYLRKIYALKMKILADILRNDTLKLTVGMMAMLRECNV
jgi:hypothetical protein